MPDSIGDITYDDIARQVDEDIAKARASQRDLTAAGDHFTAAAKGDQVDELLDERNRYV